MAAKHLVNALFPGLEALGATLCDLILSRGVQQGQAEVAIPVVVYHATAAVVHDKADLKGVLQCTQCVLKHLQARASATIIGNQIKTSNKSFIKDAMQLPRSCVPLLIDATSAAAYPLNTTYYSVLTTPDNMSTLRCQHVGLPDVPTLLLQGHRPSSTGLSRCFLCNRVKQSCFAPVWHWYLVLSHHLSLGPDHVYRPTLTVLRR